MEQHIPAALQGLLYVVSLAIVVLVAVAIPLLIRLQRQLERAVSSLEDMKADITPLAREARDLVGELRGLSGRASRIVDEVGSVVEPPFFASGLGLRLIRTGVTTFVRTLWNGKRDQKRQARWV